MKLILALLSVVLVLPAQAEDAALVKLEKEYQERRAKAVEPVEIWYEIQLGKAAADATKRGDLAAALAAQNKALQIKLEGKTFTWQPTGNTNAVITFKGRECQHSLSKAPFRWELTGDNIITLTRIDGQTCSLKFEGGGTRFSGEDFISNSKRNVTGNLKAAP